MIEALWAVLLLVGASLPASRGLALLLAAKWAVNYAAFFGLSEAAPVLVDIAAGAVGVTIATRRPTVWKDIVVAGFVLTPLVHAWYWIQHTAGTASPLLYYWLVIGLFTAQVAATAWPGGRAHARSVHRRLAGGGRRGLAGDLGHAASRRDPEGS